jgi:hypothetical protein
MDSTTPQDAKPKSEIPETASETESGSKGNVRIRSNVCDDPKAWHLVPGDLMKACGLNRYDMTTKQREEMMYYSRCSICHRTACEIAEEGCDYPKCLEQGIRSRTDIKKRKALYRTESSQ